MTPSIQYQRLTRARPRSIFAVAFVSRVSLWLTEDHLLFVETVGYTENYRRFYFRDIQSLTMQKTHDAVILNIILCTLLVPVLAGAICAADVGLKVFLFFIVGILVLLLSVNLILGTTCRCFLRTAVQVEQLPPLTRIRHYKKFLKRVRPIIIAAQGGELSLEAISEVSPQAPVSSPASPGSLTSPAQAQPNPEPVDLPPRLE